MHSAHGVRMLMRNAGKRRQSLGRLKKGIRLPAIYTNKRFIHTIDKRGSRKLPASTILGLVYPQFIQIFIYLLQPLLNPIYLMADGIKQYLGHKLWAD